MRRVGILIFGTLLALSVLAAATVGRVSAAHGHGLARGDRVFVWSMGVLAIASAVGLVAAFAIARRG